MSMSRVRRVWLLSAVFMSLVAIYAESSRAGCGCAACSSGLRVSDRSTNGLRANDGTRDANSQRHAVRAGNSSTNRERLQVGSRNSTGYAKLYGLQ